MASKNRQVNEAITDAINNSPPLDGNLTAAQKADREKATIEYLARLAAGQANMRIELQHQRYIG